MKADINIIPCPTWSWLKINKAHIDIKDFPESRISPDITGLQEGITIQENCSNENPAYLPIKTGAGKEADIFFENSSTLFITAQENKKFDKPLILHYNLQNSCKSVFNQVINAKEGSNITVIIFSESQKDFSGFQALRTTVYAEKNSYIHVVKVQLLGNKIVQLDDNGFYCKENAFTHLTHIILGGEQTYLGVLSELAEDKAVFNSNTAYLGINNQKLDMNYIVNHIGKKTSCNMKVKGTLKDYAQKNYRGTIDFKKGSCGSIGEEQEETLLLSPYVINKSIPNILCSEDDISGEHGSTAGRLGDDVLFYMQSRGFSKSGAEKIAAAAKIQSTASLIPDEKICNRILEYLDEGVKNE